MSSYWDALTRAALDLPAQATPTPRPIFEPDGGASEMVVSEASETPSGMPDRAGQARGVPQPSSAPPPPHAGDRVGTTRTEGELDRPPSAARAERSDAPQPAATPAEAGQPSQVQAPRPTPAPGAAGFERIERVEVHRIERETLVREAAAPGVEPAGEQARAEDSRESAGSLATPPEAAVLVAARAGDAQQPAVAVAIPVVASAPAEERAAPTRELPPLVIEIDRIDVRIEPEPVVAQPARSARRADSTVPSLADYLARRSGAGS